MEILYLDMVLWRGLDSPGQVGVYTSPVRIKVAESTGCLKKNAPLRLEAYNSSMEAAFGTCRDIFGFLRYSAFI